MLFRKFVERIRSDNRGSALLITAFSMPVLIGSAGLAVDTIQWSLWKSQMQRAADSASLAGAYAVGQGKSAATSATEDLRRSADLDYSVTPVVENAPTSGAYAGNNRAVRVILSTSRRLPFSGIFLSSPPVLRAEATAAIVIEGQHCLISLESSTEPGITLAGNATATLGCGVATNSRAANAVQAGGSSVLRASPITAVGGISPSGSFVGDTKIEPYSLSQADPFAGVPDPVIPAAMQPCRNLNVGTHDDLAISPGCFNGLRIQGTLRLAPGTYYINGGTLDLNSQARLLGTGVTIVLTSTTASTNPGSIATVDMNGGAEIQLTPPESGPYKDLVMYQDRRATANTNRINGNSASRVTGAFYFPKQDVLFNGTTGMQSECIQIVSRRITMSGNSSITNNCPVGYGANDNPGARVRLVG